MANHTHAHTCIFWKHSLFLSPLFSKPSECSPSNYGGNHGNYGQSVPIPVPTQVHNYQRMEENLSSPRKDSSPRSVHTHAHTHSWTAVVTF